MRDRKLVRSRQRSLSCRFILPRRERPLLAGKIGARCAKRSLKSVDLKNNKFACNKISSSTSAILFAAIFSLAQLACNFDTSALRNVCNSRLCDRSPLPAPAPRSFAIVCDYMETTLFAIVCDLRFAIRDRLRSSAIIWKPAFTTPPLSVDRGYFVLAYISEKPVTITTHYFNTF